jgi:phenylpyruvate tautomerase PptA (4-oxalocrotonate tautomerase family)
MPFLKVKLSVQESSVTSARVASILTDLTTEILRKKRELTAVEIEYVASFVGFIFSLFFMGSKI